MPRHSVAQAYRNPPKKKRPRGTIARRHRPAVTPAPPNRARGTAAQAYRDPPTPSLEECLPPTKDADIHTKSLGVNGVLASARVLRDVEEAQ